MPSASRPWASAAERASARRVRQPLAVGDEVGVVPNRAAAVATSSGTVGVKSGNGMAQAAGRPEHREVAAVGQRFPRERDAHADRDVVRRAPHHVAHHAHARIEVDEHHDVRPVVGGPSGSRAGVHAGGVDGAVAGVVAPLDRVAETARADRARVPDRRARTSVHHGSTNRCSRVASQNGARLVGRRRLATRGHRVASVPSTTVPVADSTPPQPCATATSASGTWRSPHLAAQLPHRLHEQEHAVLAGVGVRQPAAVGVRRQRPTGAELAVLHERAAFTLGAEAEVLEVQQRGDGERVVAHEHVDVVGA